MFPGHICCNAKHIWQAVHHQGSSDDSRSDDYRRGVYRARGASACEKLYSIGVPVPNAQRDPHEGACTTNC